MKNNFYFSQKKFLDVVTKLVEQIISNESKVFKKLFLLLMNL